MIKSILFLSALLGVQTMPVHTDEQYVGQQERHYQHTEDIGGNTEVTYKFESNEVNSIDDLVVGNIYNCSIPLSVFNTWSDVEFFRNSSFIYIETYEYGTIYYDMFENHLTKNGTNSVNVRLTVYDTTQTVRNIFSYSYNPSYYGNSLDFIFQYTSNTSSFASDLISYISYTPYNEIIDVTYNAPTSLFGLMADFFDQYIYSGIPHINDINYDVNGTTITMKDWLVVSTTIAVVILFLFILFFIFRWLIRTFSNAFLWR